VAINPLTPSLFAATASTEDTAAANIAGVTAIATRASAEAEASTTSDISYPNTAFIFPSRSSEILILRAASSLSKFDLIHEFMYNKNS
jgi:hypothetical protein